MVKTFNGWKKDEANEKGFESTDPQVCLNGKCSWSDSRSLNNILGKLGKLSKLNEGEVGGKRQNECKRQLADSNENYSSLPKDGHEKQEQQGIVSNWQKKAASCME